MPTETPQTNPSGARILEELKDMKAQIENQQKIINNQQAMLTSPEYINKTAPEPAAPKNPVFENMEQFMSHVQEKVIGAVDGRMEGWMGNLTPILKKATKDSPVWKVNEKAEQILGENPGMTMEVAMELAESRQETETKMEAEKAKEAQQLDVQFAADAASVGHQSTPPGSFDTRPPAEDLANIMARNWDKLDMDTQQAEHQKIDDVWGTPGEPGVKVIHTD